MNLATVSLVLALMPAHRDCRLSKPAASIKRVSRYDV